jgi:hypothetical protein
MTEAYIRALDQWVRCRVRAIRENGTATVQLLCSPAERFETTVPVFQLREVRP